MAFANPAPFASAADKWDHADMRKAAGRQFSVVAERDSEGYYVASVPEIPGCHTPRGRPSSYRRGYGRQWDMCLDSHRRRKHKRDFVHSRL